MFADATMGLSAQALAVLTMLAAEDSDDSDLEIDTRAWYNEREKGFSLTVRSHCADAKALILVCVEDRNSDRIVVDSWVVEHSIPNPPTPADYPAEFDHKSTAYGRIDEATGIIREAIKAYVFGERRVDPLVRVARQATARSRKKGRAA
jgi:hypothetical protein